MRRAVVTGAPGSGKSTLLAEVARRGIVTRPEVARAILQTPGGMELRAQKPAQFAVAMLEAQLAAWGDGEVGQGPLLYDRGFPDIVGFLKLEGLAVPSQIDAACRNCRFEGPVFHTRPWKGIYRQDAERVQSWDEAVASDEAVVQAWRDYGYDLTPLPFTDPAARARFVLEKLGV